jgi:hypothetical protein
MENWMFDDEWELDGQEDSDEFPYILAGRLADQFFLSDNEYLPSAGEVYSLGYLEPEVWWPLVNQLDEMVNLEAVVDLSDTLDTLLRLPGLPTELLEAPLDFLESILEGHLPLEPSGRRVDSRRLVKIALTTARLLQEFPAPAQSAIRAWADVHRAMLRTFADEDYEGEDLDELLSTQDLPPAVTGFSMMLGMTLMRWPERAEGMPLPPGFVDPELYTEIYAQWETLPDGPLVSEEGAGEAEALFAQGQLAHALAQLGTVEGLDPDHLEDEEVALSYSRLSRAILWLHHQCRHCPERDGVACKAASSSPQRSVPLLDVASEIANVGRIRGCIKM